VKGVRTSDVSFYPAPAPENFLKRSKSRVLIELMSEELLVNNRVRVKETGATGVIASIAEDGTIIVKLDDGTEGTFTADALEKMEEPVSPPPAEPMLGESFRKLRDGRTQMKVIKEDWVDLPKGWTSDSVKKFWGSLTGDREHKVTACMKKMSGKVDDPGAFCASLARKVGAK
jgi:hypothetical protein